MSKIYFEKYLLVPMICTFFAMAYNSSAHASPGLWVDGKLVRIDSDSLYYRAKIGLVRINRHAMPGNLTAELEKAKNWEKSVHLLVPIYAIQRK